MTIDSQQNVGFIIPEKLARNYIHLIKVEKPLQDELIKHYSNQNILLKKFIDSLNHQLKVGGSGMDSCINLLGQLEETEKKYALLGQKYHELRQLHDKQITLLSQLNAEKNIQNDMLGKQRDSERKKYEITEESYAEVEKIAKAKGKWKKRASLLAATTAILSVVLILK